MASTKTPVRTQINPDQGELLSGVQPDPHFQAAARPDVVYGLSVDLEERNAALQSAASWLGRLARTNSFLEIGRGQAEGRRTPAVKNVEKRYSPQELHEKLSKSEEAKTGMEKAVEGKLKQAFGFDELVKSELFPEVTEDKVENAFRSGRVPITDSTGKKLPPGPKEGKKEFEQRFAGSNNRYPRDQLVKTLGRQATQIRKVKRATASRP